MAARSQASLPEGHFGPAFDRWGEITRVKIDDALASIVGCYGLPIIGGTVGVAGVNLMEKRPLADLVWNACFVKGVAFRNVHFSCCDFTSSFMDNCDFVSCLFTECKLCAVGISGGSISETRFEGCDVKSIAVMKNEWRDVSLEGCDASGMLVMGDSEWDGEIEFKKSDLKSATMKRIKLKGHLKFEDCTLHYAQIKRFVVDGHHERLEIEGCRLHGALVEDYYRIPHIDDKGNEDVDTEDIVKGPPDEHRTTT